MWKWNLRKPSLTRYGPQTKLKQASPGCVVLACWLAPKYLSSVGAWDEARHRGGQRRWSRITGRERGRVAGGVGWAESLAGWWAGQSDEISRGGEMDNNRM